MVINLSYLVPAILMPIAGHIIDKKGRIIQFLYFSGMMELIGHLTNILLPDCGPDDG
jgi:MFS-type transporter involved in bile tolerance (Atg22 family)